jgi:hypothetical protein
MKLHQIALRPTPAIGLATLLILTCAGAWLLFAFDPATHGFYPVCALYRTTGLQCPGCGSLRAVHQLLHGNVRAAWHFNALLVASLPLMATLTCRFLVRKRRGQDPWALSSKWLWAALIVVVAFAILRNLP